MILALDTAGPWVCAALGDERGLHTQVRRSAHLNHNEVLPQVYAEVATGLPPWAGVAVNQGPGSFTGTRVGVAFVAGLCQALGVHALAVSSFQVAASLAPRGARRVRVILPLVRDVWGVGLLLQEGDVWHEESCVEMTNDQLRALHDFDQLISPWAEWPGAQPAPADWNPAAVVLALALREGPTGFHSPRQLRARYLGKSQAERVFEARHGS